MTTEEELIEILTKLSSKCIDGKVIYWEFEAVARRELSIDHDEFWDLIEKFVKEGKIEAIVSKNMADVYFKPKERDGRE